MFSVVFIIYNGLLIFWIQSVRQRLLPTGARTYMITAVLFMMLLLILRAVKYRISAGVIMDRYCWYAYYFPIVMIPTLFLLACISINKGKKTTIHEGFLIIPALLIAFGIFTNDLHHLVFIPAADISVFIGETGTYSYGPLFYAAYAWIVLCVIAGIVYLICQLYQVENR